MNTSLKTAKMSILLGILLISLFAFAVPTISAGPIKNTINKLYTCNCKVEIDYDAEIANDPFLPIDMTKDIPINVSYSIAGYFAEEIMPYYKGVDTFIYLYIDEKPDWCTAIISPAILNIAATISGVSKQAILSIKVNENADAFFEGKIRIRAEATKLGAVQGGIFYPEIRFKPGYLPLLKIDAAKETYKLIGPYDTANFNINIENMGNAKTRIRWNIKDLPDGWSAHIDDSTIIGSRISGEDTNKTFQLVVKPPYGFGYHDERQEIKVSIMPSYFDNESLKGNEYNLSFIVQSRGFSTPGFEFIFLLFAVIIIVLIFKKQHGKNKFHKQNKEDQK